jgi:hypothetical protein
VPKSFPQQHRSPPDDLTARPQRPRVWAPLSAPRAPPAPRNAAQPATPRSHTAFRRPGRKPVRGGWRARWWRAPELPVRLAMSRAIFRYGAGGVGFAGGRGARPGGHCPGGHGRRAPDPDARVRTPPSHGPQPRRRGDRRSARDIGASPVRDVPARGTQPGAVRRFRAAYGVPPSEFAQEPLERIAGASPAQATSAGFSRRRTGCRRASGGS